MVKTIAKLGTNRNVFAGTTKEIKAIGEDLRTVIIRLHPDAVEVPRKGYKATSYGFGESMGKESYCYIAPKKTYVNLGFEWGTSLEDRDSLLEGTGKKMRHIKVSNQKMARSAGVAALVWKAIDERRQTLDGISKVSSLKKTTERKPAAKKATTKKKGAKEPAAKKTATKKAAAKPTEKKEAVKKPAAKEAAAKTKTTKKSAKKKVAPKKVAARSSSRSTAARKPAEKKQATAKATTKRGTAKKPVAKKAATKKAATKPAAKRSTAKPNGAAKKGGKKRKS